MILGSLFWDNIMYDTHHPIFDGEHESERYSSAWHPVSNPVFCVVLWGCFGTIPIHCYRLFDHAQFNVLSGYRVSFALLQNIRQVEVKNFLIQDENIKSLKPPSNRSDRTLVCGFPEKKSVEIIIPGRMQNSSRQPMISEIKISIIIKILNILISLSIYLLMISSYYLSK